mgnify:CR=1 FL=1
MIVVKKTVFFLLILISLIFLSCSVFAVYDVVSGEVNVYVNDTKIVFDTQPVFIKNRTMVPIRGVFEAMGATVDWDNNEKIVTIEKGIKIQVQLDNPKALIDGKTILMDVPAAGINGRILVPIRFISEALKANVDWVNSTKTVFINEEVKNTDSGNNQNWGKFYANEVWNYYIMEGFVLLKENIETKKLEKIADNVVCDLHIYDDWVYYIGIDKGMNKVLRINQYSKEKEIIVDAPIDSIQVVNNWVYYSHSGEETILYRTKADGSVTERIIGGGNFHPKSWLIQNGWIYFQNLKSNTISRARIDGSDLTEMTKLYATPPYDNSNSISDFGDSIFEIKLIDKDFLYLSLGNPGYIGEFYYDSGIYRIPINGGNPEIITNKVPVSINMDDAWIYMAVKSYSSYQLVKCRKDGSELFTINEYKQNDIPKSIYINNSTLLYTLLRGSGAQEELFFKMSSLGGNISTFSIIYGNDYYQIRDILTEASNAYGQLDSLSMLQISSSGKENDSIITSESKISNTQSLYYQNIKHENEAGYLETWTDKMFLYSRNADESQWNIKESPISGKTKPYTVLDYIQPTQELSNNLSLKTEYGKYIISGKGAFPELINKLLEAEVLVYDYSGCFIDSAALVISIDRNSNYIEELKLEIYYYDIINKKSYTSRYQFVNSLFNSIYLNRPPELFQSVNDKNRAMNNIESGKKKLSEGKYEDAIALFDTAISFYSKAFDAYIYKGDALYSQGKYEEAISNYEQYFKLNPSDIEVLTHQGICYLKLGSLNKAEELAKAVLAVNNYSVKAYNLAGAVAFAREDYPLAYEYYNKAITLDPGFYEAHIQIMNTLFNAGNYTKCIEAANEFLTRFPGDRNIMFTKARCLSHQGNSTSAIMVFKDILLMDPSNDFVTMTYIAIEYENLQNYTKAQEYAEKAQVVYADYSLLRYLIQKLEYDISISSSQKLVDFLMNYYLYYVDSNDLKKALDNFIIKRNNFNLDDIKSLIEAIKSPDDTSTLIVTGSDYKNLINFDDNSFMEVKEETDLVYIKIKKFSNKSGIKFSEYIQSLAGTKNKALLLDLRDTTGGLSDEANIMLDVLLGECNAGYIIDRDGYIRVFKSGKSHIVFNRIGILVNEKTAGSSELLTLGLKTYLNNVTIIGKKTVGKGIGQILYLDREKEYAIFLVNHYWNVKQENIHGKGIMPDIKVDDNETEYKEAIELFLNGM